MVNQVKDVAPNPEPADPVREFFNRLAGSDGEVDWQELKEILDYAMREGMLHFLYFILSGELGRL